MRKIYKYEIGPYIDHEKGIVHGSTLFGKEDTVIIDMYSRDNSTISEFYYYAPDYSVGNISYSHNPCADIATRGTNPNDSMRGKVLSQRVTCHNPCFEVGSDEGWQVSPMQPGLKVDLTNPAFESALDIIRERTYGGKKWMATTEGHEEYAKENLKKLQERIREVDEEILERILERVKEHGKPRWEVTDGGPGWCQVDFFGEEVSQKVVCSCDSKALFDGNYDNDCQFHNKEKI